MPSAATCMDSEIILLSEVSQKEKDKFHMTTYMWNLKYNTNQLPYKTETDSDIEHKFTVTKGERTWGRDKLEVWDQQIQTTIYKTDKKQGPTIHYILYTTIHHRELYSISCDNP